PQAVDDVVQPRLQELQHQLAGAATVAGCLAEQVTQVPLGDSVDRLKLLLLQQLAPVFRQLAPGSPSMLAGGIGPLQGRALGRSANGFAKPPADAVLRSGVSCHRPSILQYPPVMFASSHGNTRGFTLTKVYIQRPRIKSFLRHDGVKPLSHE